MAPRQKTFELVPNAPQGLRGLAQHQQQQKQESEQPVYSKPPMTTKQAKKLHRQANKGPKLSKAEQRRIELMEQDRIRKEFEKERQQARARTARERKKAKEEKERSERRKKGLPMVDVHPSQDVISRFIKRDVGQKRDSIRAATRLNILREEDTDTATEAESGADAGDEEEEEEEETSDKENQEPAREFGDERNAKRPRLGQPEDKMSEGFAPVPRPHPAGAVAKIAQDLGTDSCSRASSVDVDDPINETLLENQLIADVLLASSRKNANSSPVEQSPPADSTPSHARISLAGSTASKDPPPPRASSPKSQGPQRAKPPVTAVPFPSDTGTEDKGMHRFEDGSFKKPLTPCAAVAKQGPAIKSPAVRAQTAPPKFKQPAVQQSRARERPRFLPKHFRTPQQQQHALAYEASGQSHAQFPETTSTQQYLLHHLDDIFPSPSQEAAELSGVQIRLVGQDPRPTMIKTNLSEKVIQQSVNPSRARLESTPLALSSTVDAPLDFPISTQELFMSSQDIRDIETPSKVRRSPLVEMTPQMVDGKTQSPDALQSHSCGATGFLSTTASNPQKPKAAILSQASTSRNESHLRKSGGVGCYQVTAGPESVLGAHPSGDKMSNSSLRKTSHEAEETQKGSCTPKSSHQQCSSVQHPRATPRSSNASLSKTAPRMSPPKKRMFGSSGPGAEVLVAMERSYQESRRKERVREEALRSEKARQHTAEQAVEVAAEQVAEQAQMDLQLMGLAEDDFLDDDLSPTTKSGGDVVTRARDDSGGCGVQAASQETDYGGSELDAEKEVLDLLEADMTWLDDDLDDCI